MIIRKEELLCIASAFGALVAVGDGTDLVSNVYAKVDAIYAAEWNTPENTIMAVRCGGVDNELTMTNFLPFCEFVSNNCAMIVADWRAYETNEFVRFTTLSAIGYSGYANYTNALDVLLSQHETDADRCSWETIRFLSDPYGTPACHSLAWTYDLPGVSNIVMRIRASASLNNATNNVMVCDGILNGTYKAFCEDLISIGDWTPPSAACGGGRPWGHKQGECLRCDPKRGYEVRKP